jgi:signal transduction histidine kinase
VTFVSHQLKSPLVPIRQYMDVLLRLEGSEEAAKQRAEWLTRSRRRCDQMVRLIEDWLTLSGVECSELVRRREPLDLRRALTEIADACQGPAGEKGVSLDLSLPERELVVAGDEGCVGVLFSNLVENAITYNRPGGRVSVEVRVERGEVCVSVSDTGRGIPPECLDLVFDEFFRVKEEGEQAPAGTGLGLPISRRIAAEMGGTIELRSELGTGSTFTVRLPLVPAGSDRPALEREAVMT